MTDDPAIVVIVPVFNENEKIRGVISELSKSGYNKIVVVDDGSEQPIRNELAGFGVHLLRHSVNIGQGAALQTGCDYAKYLAPEVIVTFDGDGQHDCRDIKALIGPILRDEADIVFGSRFLNGATSNLSFSRRCTLKVARLVNFIFSGILLSDAHNGLRAFNLKTLNLLEITENRMAHASEILFEVQKHNLRYKEIGVNVKYTPYSVAKGQSGWNGLRIVLDLIVHQLFRPTNKLK